MKPKIFTKISAETLVEKNGILLYAGAFCALLKLVGEIDTWGQYHKTLCIHNLLKRYRFCSELVSFGLDKHTSLSKQIH